MTQPWTLTSGRATKRLLTKTSEATVFTWRIDIGSQSRLRRLISSPMASSSWRWCVVHLADSDAAQ